MEVVTVENQKKFSLVVPDAKMKLERGVQILYIPRNLKSLTTTPNDHSNWGYPLHILIEFHLDFKGIQPGFVTSGPNARGRCYFCRFWHSDKTGIGSLRTKSSSEPVPVENLVVYMTVNSKIIEATLKEYC